MSSLPSSSSPIVKYVKNMNRVNHLKEQIQYTGLTMHESNENDNDDDDNDDNVVVEDNNDVRI